MYTIIAFYKFVGITDCVVLQQTLKDFCRRYDLCGSILIASEGINATVAGSQASVDELAKFLLSDPLFEGIRFKIAYSNDRPFGKMKVRLKKEIITFGAPEANPVEAVGTYVKPTEWNALICDPDVTVLDTRNSYEVVMGTFERALDPQTQSFTKFKEYIDHHLDPQRNKKIAMFCTGGIRCEKATSYLLQKGFENVYHLEGGILNYLNEIPTDKSLFRGECYVFDNRITVKSGLEQGSYELIPHTDNQYIKKD